MGKRVKNLRGLELLKAVWNVIRRRPEGWDQSEWHRFCNKDGHCKTTHCFAGYAQVLAGRRITKADIKNRIGYASNPREDAQELLDLSDDEANKLFSGDNSLEDIGRFVTNKLMDNGQFPKF